MFDSHTLDQLVNAAPQLIIPAVVVVGVIGLHLAYLADRKDILQHKHEKEYVAQELRFDLKKAIVTELEIKKVGERTNELTLRFDLPTVRYNVTIRDEPAFPDAVPVGRGAIMAAMRKYTIVDKQEYWTAEKS